ncbi:MAG: alpha/beta hydrolase [Anaerolineales bacterium]|nr:alpha/beta hydrolase [Anaerolineales bacterium]
MQPFFDVAGAGPDLLLLHGWASSRHLWKRLIPTLAASFRCWSIDLPGFGSAPDLGPRAIDAEAYSLWLNEFCDAHGIGACGLVGHSMGGALTLRFAADQPERVRAFAAINPVVTGRVILRLLNRLPARSRWMGWSQELSQTVLGPLLAQPALDQIRELIWPVQRRIDDFNQASGPALLHTWDLLAGFDVRPRLATVTAPGLIVVGSLDLNVPNSEGMSAVAALPNARLVRFVAGHTITDTKPHAVAELLRSFFQHTLPTKESAL